MSRVGLSSKDSGIYPESLYSFVMEIEKFLRDEIDELQRLRKETYVYSYGSILAPFLVIFLETDKTKRSEAFWRTALFLGGATALSIVPKWIQELFQTVLMVYNIYTRAVSSAVSISVGALLRNAIDSIKWSEDRKWLKDEFCALLLLIIDTTTPNLVPMKAADDHVKATIDTGAQGIASYAYYAVGNSYTAVMGFFYPTTAQPPVVDAAASGAAAQVAATPAPEVSSPPAENQSAAAEVAVEPAAPKPAATAQASASSADTPPPASEPALATAVVPAKPEAPTSWSAFQKLGIDTIWEQWKVVWHAFKCSDFCYGDKPLNDGFERIGNHITHGKLKARLDIMKHPDQNVIYLAFKGSNRCRDWLRSNPRIVIAGKPGCAEHSMVDFIKEFQKNNPASKIIITGHSLGAALASYYSAKTGLPAITFDCPGLPAWFDHYDLSRVISFQSTVNLVNTGVGMIAAMLGKMTSYGAVYVLDPPNTISVLKAATLVLSHTRDNIHDALAGFVDVYRDRGEASSSHWSNILNFMLTHLSSVGLFGPTPVTPAVKPTLPVLATPSTSIVDSVVRRLFKR